MSVFRKGQKRWPYYLCVVLGGTVWRGYIFGNAAILLQSEVHKLKFSVDQYKNFNSQHKVTWNNFVDVFAHALHSLAENLYRVPYSIILACEILWHP